jgi:hypothetical protein
MTTTYDHSYSESGVAAIFPSRESAHEAVRRLHNSGIQGTWIGLIKPRETSDPPASVTSVPSGGTRVEAENWLGRLLGEGDETLQDALTRHGVGAIDSTVLGAFTPEGALVTVDGRGATSDTVDILENCGGRVIAGRANAFVDDIDLNSGATGDPVTTVPASTGTVDTIREETFFYDPAYEIQVGDPAAQRLARPII